MSFEINDGISELLVAYISSFLCKQLGNLTQKSIKTTTSLDIMDNWILSFVCQSFCVICFSFS